MKLSVKIRDGEYWWGGSSSEIDRLPRHDWRRRVVLQLSAGILLRCADYLTELVRESAVSVSAPIDVLPYFVKCL